MPSFKFFLETAQNNGEIRRFSTDQNLSWDAFVHRLQTVLGTLYHPELRVQYVDSEGDRITVSSETEWQEALQNLQKTPLKFFICETSSRVYFKDGPAPEPQGFYVKTEKTEEPLSTSPPKEPINEEPKQEVKEDKKESNSIPNIQPLKIIVPECLSHYFPGGKILPYNIPTWLKESGAISLKPLPNNEVDMDVDIPKLFSLLQKRAIEFLSQNDFASAKSLLLDALSIGPTNPVAHYNLGCTEALIGNIKSAIDYLNSAVQSGYQNWQHMQKDTDLKVLWNNSDFVDLINKMKGLKEEPKKEEPKKEEPKKEEPKKEEPKKEEPKVEPKKEEPKKEEPKKEEPKKEEPKKEEPKVITKWATELQIVRDMGFFNDALTLQLLDKHNGGVNQVIQEFLN